MSHAAESWFPHTCDGVVCLQCNCCHGLESFDICSASARVDRLRTLTSLGARTRNSSIEMISNARVAFVLACLVALVMSAAASTANYADVRSHVSHAFEERAHEMNAVLGVLQEVSKATLAGIKALEAKCGTVG